MLPTHTLEYQDDDTTLEAYYALPSTGEGKKPAVIIVHDWSGRNEFVCEKARKIAELGYIGIAIDMYGKGKIGKTTEEKKALMAPLVQDRSKLLRRIQAAMTAAKTLPQVDTKRMGGMGFCFGGLCILDLARSGANLVGVVSFHGALSAPPTPTTTPLQSKILALHGHEDPMVPPEQVAAFEKEMTDAKADWQMHIYSQTQHAFMNPEANDPNMGIVYNEKSAKRAWITMKDFFAEVL